MSNRWHPFDQLLQLDTAYIKLDCAALHFATDVYPELNLHRYLTQLDWYADEVRKLRPANDAIARYEALREVLVENHGFHGNADDYYDPRNSYLNCILDRKIGVPIGLSVVWLAVAQRLNWPVVGIGFPRHFLIRFDDRDRFVIADPFYDGRSLSLDDCRQLLDDTRDAFDESPRPTKLKPEYLAPLDTRAIVRRMLNNLRTVYMINNDWPALENVLKRLAALDARKGRHLCELAALHARMGNMKRAYAHLALFLEREPRSADTPLIRHSMQRLEAAISALN
jgi:regulator of sirC expression with transglutaminase-like and TPR domain